MRQMNVCLVERTLMQKTSIYKYNIIYEQKSYTGFMG